MAVPITVSLDKDLLPLWSKFHSIGTEMIVTKERGRKLFPSLDYTVRGLQPEAHYVAVLMFQRQDDYRYKFSCQEWQTNGAGEARLPEQPHINQDRAVDGRTMMAKKIRFDYLRITNNPQNTKMVLLQSMHKYQPVLRIFQVAVPFPPEADYDYIERFCHPVAYFAPEYAQFIAVTAYFNDKVKNLKIEKNKYAKGHKGDKFSPRMKTTDSPSPSSTYSSPHTSPGSEISPLAAARNMPYPIPTAPLPYPMMWNDMYPFPMFPNQMNPLPDFMYNPYASFMPMQPPAYDE